MQVQRATRVRNNGETSTFDFNLNSNPLNSKVYINIEIAGTGSKTTTGKAIKGRLHPDAPWFTIASPSNTTAVTNNTTTLVCPFYQITATNAGGVGIEQTHLVSLYT